MAAYTVLSLFLLSLIVFVNTAPFYWPLPPFVWLTAARLSQRAVRASIKLLTKLSIGSLLYNRQFIK